MASSLKLFYAFLVLCICKQGWAAPCTLSNIAVQQAKTGAVVEGKPEFEVTISNNCICTQSNLLVRCTGFSSVEKVNPALFNQVDNDHCLVNSGNPISQSFPVKFKYAWSTPYDLPPTSSQVNCS